MLESTGKQVTYLSTLINFTEGYLTHNVFMNGDNSSHSSFDASLKYTTDIPEI